MSKKRVLNPEDDIQLPDPREVNRQERLKRQREKEDERKAKRGDGLFRKPLEVAQKRYPKDPHAQIEYLFQEGTVPAGIGRHRFVSDRRLQAFRDVLHRLVRLLRERRTNIQNLDQLGKAHVLSAMKAWQEEGLTEGTIQGYLSVMRRFFCLCGKPKVLPTDNELRDWLRANGLTAGTIGRVQVPELAKGWRDLGICPESFIQTLRSQGEDVVATIAEMALHWGLRAEEGRFLRPHESEHEGNGVGLVLRRGTKGDKVRLVKWFQDPERARIQREVLERAKRLADLNPRRELAIPGLNAKQMKNHFNWVLRRNGVTKDAMGVTFHGLRHQFACDLFRDITGMPAPVLGLLPAEEYRKNAVLVRHGMKEVSIQMGHERISISGSYVGSVGKLDKGQTRRTDQALERVLAASEAFRQAPVLEAWLVGTYGRGAVAQPGESIEIAVRPADRPDEPLTLKEFGDVLLRLENAVTTVAGLPVRARAWLAPEMPEDAAEILFQQGPAREQPGATA